MTFDANTNFLADEEGEMFSFMVFFGKKSVQNIQWFQKILIKIHAVHQFNYTRKTNMTA